MRVENISISERYLMFAIAGQLFEQAPNRQPRKAEIIMQRVKEVFRKDAFNDNEYFSLVVNVEDVYNYIESLLMSIPEFIELNLSQIEFENNIGVDDESRPKYSLSSRYDKHTSESWKTDFIDLDAFIGNVHRKILYSIDADNDCFLCKYEATDKCRRCRLNPMFDYYYESFRRPKGEYTFSCKHNCYRHYQICCEECTEKDSCEKVCDGSSNTCGNATLE